MMAIDLRDLVNGERASGTTAPVMSMMRNIFILYFFTVAFRSFVLFDLFVSFVCTSRGWLWVCEMRRSSKRVRKSEIERVSMCVIDIFDTNTNSDYTYKERERGRETASELLDDSITLIGKAESRPHLP